MTLIKFNDEMMMRFIRAYKQTACLWDTKHPSYKDRAIRNISYHYLVDVMDIPGFTVADVRNKIKNIRSTYCQELKKINQRKRLGLKPYVPTNIWFAEVHEFLSTNILHREAQSNYVVMNYPTGDIDIPCVVSSMSSINGEMADFDNTATSFGDSSQAASGMLENFSVPGETANGTSVDVHSSLEATLKHLEKLSESLVRQQKQKEDEFDCFGKSIAVQLKKLPLTSAMKLKVKIQTLLTEERITCLDANRKNTSEPSDNNSVVMEEEEEDIERLIECTAIIKEKEERPPSRSSELSLHVSCSSSDDDDSEREDG